MQKNSKPQCYMNQDRAHTGKPFHPGLSQGPSLTHSPGGSDAGQLLCSELGSGPFPPPTAVPDPWHQQPPEVLLRALGVSCHLRRTMHTHPLPVPGGRVRRGPPAKSTGPRFPFCPARLHHQPQAHQTGLMFWLLAGGHHPFKGLLSPTLCSVSPALCQPSPLPLMLY